MQNDQTPATPDADPGFKLPGETDTQARPEATPEATPATGQVEVVPSTVEEAPVTDTSTRDLAIGAGVFAVLLLVFFFVRNSYVHHLVVRRVAPSAAGNAGWLMFVGLAFLSSAAVLAIINASKFLAFAVTAPLVAVGLLSLVAAVFVGRR
ncbi:MAG TPA: hypothetical protein VGD30_04400 [Telluria sp.]